MTTNTITTAIQVPGSPVAIAEVQPLEMTDDLWTLTKRYRALRRRRDVVDVEMKQIANRFKELSALTGIRSFLHRGRQAVSISPENRRSCNYELLKTMFPAAYEMCVSENSGNRINVK